MIDREFFLGFVKIHILYHAIKEPIYGVEIMRELARHGYDISPGTLYPMLHRMERDGYLVSNREVVAGKARKYYRATEAGLSMLDQSKKQIMELVKEVIDEK